MSQQIDLSTTKHTALLANLPVDDHLLKQLQQDFDKTIDYVSIISKLNTTHTQETHHVTGLENIFRSDKIDKDRILTQKEALSNSSNSHQGYFVVPSVIET